VSFGCLSSSSKCAVGEAQLSVEVLAAAPGQVSFRLINEGDEPLTASQLFFDDVAGVLGDLLSVLDDVGVVFLEGGKPDDLKGGKKIGFEADAFVSAAKPAKDNGVNPGEDVLVLFALAGTHTFEDVIAALESGGLRIGINAKRAYVNVTTGTVPEPGKLCLLALGLGATVWSARRRS
jgi:hypothetical protein